MTFTFQNIPEELKQSHRWVRGALCDVKQADGSVRKLCKPPFNSRTGEHASHSDPKTWSSYVETIAAHEVSAALKPNNSVVTIHAERYVGIVCGAPWIFGDIDHCVENGEIADREIAAWVEELKTYTEISPSGTGLRFILHGEPPYANGHRKDQIEVYSTKRWVTLTGNVLPGHEEIRRFGKDEVTALYAKVKAGRSVRDSRTPANSASEIGYTSAQIADMMNRADFLDPSQAVQSLLTLLAIEHVCNREKIETEFKKSKLYTDTHWSEKWKRLGEGELDLAIQHAQENISKRLTRIRSPEKRALVMPDASWTRRQPLRWFWKPVMLRGAMMNLSGESSQGKSPITVDLAARLSKLPGHDGFGLWPDGQPMERAPLHTIMLNIEDDLHDTILPRFDAAGGCDLFLHPITGVQVSKDDSHHQRMLALEEDIELICAEARNLAPNLGMITLDPITNYLGRLKMNQEEDVRRALTPLVLLAQELGIVVVTVSHLNKGESQDPMSRVMGARAFIGVPRCAWQCNRDPNSQNPYEHILSPVRGPVGHESFQYHTEIVNSDIDGESTEVVRIVWDGKSKASATQALNPESRKNIGLIQKAAPILRDFLKGGKRSAAECLLFLKEGGYDITECSDRVREVAGVKSMQKERRWWWYLPAAESLFEKSEARATDNAPSF